MTIFFLEAFEYVNQSKTAEYEEMGASIDAAVKKTEPGMLVHVQTKVSETETESVYRWLEVYKSYDDLLTHINSPELQAHTAAIEEKQIMSRPGTVVIYCDWSDEQKEPFSNAEENPVGSFTFSFAPLVNGYFL